MEASVERLFLIVNPTAEIKYDQVKEDKYALASKQAELARVEEAKKKAADQGKTNQRPTCPFPFFFVVLIISWRSHGTEHATVKYYFKVSMIRTCVNHSRL